MQEPDILWMANGKAGLERLFHQGTEAGIAVVVGYPSQRIYKEVNAANGTQRRVAEDLFDLSPKTCLR